MSDIYGHIIVIKRNGQDGAAYPLASDVCLFGKGQDCDVRVQLPSVSEEHCVLRVGTKRRVYLTSMSRLNMTLLNNVPVNGTVPVNHMDTLTVVDRSFRFQYPVDSVYAEDIFNSVPKVMALKIISPKQKPPLPVASYEKEGTRDSDGDTSAELSLSRGKASPSLRGSDTSKIDAFLSLNPKKTYGKKSSSPGYRLSVSTRRKRVSFGPTLSPEQFIKSMPPATPVRKGSLPFRRQSSVPDYFGSPVITQYSGSRKSRISFVLKNDSIGEEVPSVHGKRSPQTPQNVEMTVKESVTKFSPKRRPKQKQKLNSPSGKLDSAHDATSINITSVVCHQKMHSPRRRITVRQSPVKLDHAENSFSLPANADLYDRWSQDSNYSVNISPKTNGKSLNNSYMSTPSPRKKIKAGTSNHERKSGIGNCKTVDGIARTTDCSPVDKKINNSKKKGPKAKVLKRLSRGKDIPRRVSLATVKISDSFKKDYSYSRKLRKSLPVLRSSHVTDQKSTRSKEIHNESPLIKAKIDAVLSRRSSRGSIKKPIKSAAALEVDDQTQEIIGTKRKIEYSPVKQSAKKGQFSSFTNNTATPALLRQEKCMVVKSSSVRKTSKTPIKTPKKNDSSVKSKKKGAFSKKSVQKLLWTEVVQKGIMKKNVGRKPKVVRSLLSRAIKRRNPSSLSTQLKNCNRKAVPLSERVLSGTSTGHANSPQTIVINKKIKSSRFPPKSVTHKTPSKTPASSVKSVTPRSTSSTNRVKKLNKSYSSILLDVSSIQTPNISQEMFVSPLTSPRNHTKRSFITKFINENQQVSSRDEPSSPKQIKSNSKRANHKSENLTGLKKLLTFSPTLDYTNVKGIKNLFRTPNRSPKADYTDVKGIKNLLRTPSRSPKADYTDVKGIKNLLRTPSRSPKADFTDVKGIKELMLTPRRTPIANYSDVKGVKGLLQTPKGTPKADYTDVSGVKKLFKTASPKEKYSANQLKNAVSLKGRCSKASPKADYSNTEGLKNLFKMANKHKANKKMGSCNKEPDYGNVEGVKQLFQSMQDISEFNISGLQELFLTPTVSSPSSVRSSLRSHERKDNTIISAKTPKLRAATPHSLRKQYNSYSKNISCSSFPNSCDIQSGKSNLYLDTTPTINYEKDILISGVILDSVGSLDFSGHRQSKTPNPKVITQLPHMGQISENDTSFPPYSELHDIHSDKSNIDLSVTDSSYKNDTLSQESFIILDSISSRQTSTLRRLKDSFSTHCTVHAFHVNTRSSLANSLSHARSSGMAIPSASKGLRSHDSFISSEGLDLTAQQVLSKSALDGLDSKSVSPLYSDGHLNKIPEVKKDEDINSSNFAEKIGTNYIEHSVSLSDLPKRSLRRGRKGQNVSEIKMEFCKSATSDTGPCPTVEIPKRRGRKTTAVNIDKPMRNSKVKASGKRGRKNMSDIGINNQGMHLQGNEVKSPKIGKLSKAHQNSDEAEIEWVSKTRGCKNSKIIKEQSPMTNKQSNYKKPTKKPRETSNSELLPTQNGHSVPVIISTKTSNKTRGRGKRRPIIPEIFIIGNSSVHNDNSVVGVQYETNGHNVKSSSQDDSGTVDFQKNTDLLVTGDISAKADQIPVTTRGSSHCHSKKDRSVSSRVLRARRNLSSLNESDIPDVETTKVVKSPKDLSKNTEGKVEPEGKSSMDGKVEKSDQTPKRKQTSRQFLEYKDAEKCPSTEGTNYVKRSIKANAQSKVAASGRKRKASDEDPQHSSPQKKTRGAFKIQKKGGSTESKQSDEKKNSKLKKEMVELPSNLPWTLSPILEQKEDDVKTPVSKKRGRRTKTSLKQTIEQPFSQRITRSRRKM